MIHLHFSDSRICPLNFCDVTFLFISWSMCQNWNKNPAVMRMLWKNMFLTIYVYLYDRNSVNNHCMYWILISWILGRSPGGDQLTWCLCILSVNLIILLSYTLLCGWRDCYISSRFWILKKTSILTGSSWWVRIK